MNITPKFFDGWKKTVSRRRERENGLHHLSDWQVYSAHIVAMSISSVSVGFHKGPIYVPMPTGSGKTTGAIWGIIDVLRENPDERICFLTPYIESVDHVYEELTKKLGSHMVGRYHAKGTFNKEAELSKPVVVLTHQFVPANKGRLDDRTLSIIDEAIYATGEVSLHRSEFAKASQWATSNNVLSKEFVLLENLVGAMVQPFHEDGEKEYATTPTDVDLSFAKAIAFDLNLPSYSQNIEDMQLMSSVQLYCAAILEGQAFAARGSTGKSGGYDPTFYAAALGLPKPEKTIVLTATGGLIYARTGKFKASEAVKDYWSPPSYENLRVVSLTGPELKGRYKSWGTEKSKREVIQYVDWVLQTIPETTIYLTLPKQVLDRCLLGYLGHTGKEDKGSFVVEKHGKTIHVSHHSLSIGSNEFRECDAVVYLFDDHKPQALFIQRYHTLTGQPVTEDTLKAVEGGKLKGDYKEIKIGSYLENMMQHLGRGKIRTFDDKGVANPMTAYVFSQQSGLVDKLADQYPSCQRETLHYPKSNARQPKGRLVRVLQYLREQDGRQTIQAKEVEDVVKFPIRQISSLLEGNYDLENIGYIYVKGEKGRGRKGYFVSIKPPNKLPNGYF